MTSVEFGASPRKIAGRENGEGGSSLQTGIECPIVIHTCMPHPRRLATIAMVCLGLPLFTGCSAVSGFVADALPTWAGGLPAEAPPRPSDPRYPEYERAMRARAIAEAPANGEALKPEPIK